MEETFLNQHLMIDFHLRQHPGGCPMPYHNEILTVLWMSQIGPLALATTRGFELNEVPGLKGTLHVAFMNFFVGFVFLRWSGLLINFISCFLS